MNGSRGKYLAWLMGLWMLGSVGFYLWGEGHNISSYLTRLLERLFHHG